MRATLIARAAGAEGLSSRLEPLLLRLGERLGRERCTLSILLTDDEGIRDYNRRFRQRDEATDVLSFPTGAGSGEDSGHYVGDLVISLETARAQAQQQGHDTEDEVEVLVLHGVLHLLGHDHERDRGEMRELEAEIARELLGSTRGLVERTRTPDEPPSE